MSKQKLVVPLTSSLQLHLPVPLHQVGTAAELMRGDGTWVERCPNIERKGEQIRLSFAPLDDGLLQRDGRAGALSSLVEWLPELDSFEAIQQDVQVRFGAEAAGVGIVSAMTDHWCVHTIDFAAAGWAPGDEFVYLSRNDGESGTVLISPTHWLRYRWEEVRIVHHVLPDVPG